MNFQSVLSHINLNLFLLFSASAVPMDNIKLQKNFTLFRESMKVTLDAFKAGKTMADVTQEVFQVMAPTAPALTLALVPVDGGSRSIASRASIPAKVPTSSKSPAAPKTASREPISISKYTESSLREGARVAPLDVPPLQAMGAIVIGGVASKRARISKPATESRLAK